MYIDTGLFAKLFVPEPESDRVQAVVSGTSELVCSELLIVEFSSVLSRKVRECALTPEQTARIRDEFDKLLEAHLIHLLPLDRKILTDSVELLHDCGAAAPLRSLDGIHLASCQQYSVRPLFTMDRVMLRVADYLGIPVLPL